MQQKTIHPLNNVFSIEENLSTIDIEQNYAITEQHNIAETKQEKDEEDKEIDAKIDNIYDVAMEAFNNQTTYTEIIEPRYAARNAEVAANYLNIALNAAASRAKIKTDRKRNNTFVPFGGNKTTNNLIVADRNEILKMIQVDDKKENLQNE